MKILHVIPSISRDYGGPTQSLIRYLKASEAVGIRASVVSTHCAIADQRSFRNEAEGVDPKLFPSFGKGAFIISPLLLWWIFHHGNEYDLIHVHGVNNSVSSLTTKICLKKNWPVIVRPFGTLSRYTYSHRRSRLKKIYFKLLDGPNIAKIGGLHFTTEQECLEAGWHGIDFSNRSYIIPPSWQAEEDIKSLRKRNEGISCALLLSRLDPVKNIEGLLQAWSYVIVEKPNAKLVIAGTGISTYTKTLKALVRSLRLEHNVSFPGFVDGQQKTDLMSEAQLFVLTSLHENFGISVLEAISAGLPVVISPEVQLAHFVREHGLGIVTEGDPRSTADAILGAFADVELKAHCSTNGQEIVSRFFAPNTVGRNLLHMYESVSLRPWQEGSGTASTSVPDFTNNPNRSINENN